MPAKKRARARAKEGAEDMLSLEQAAEVLGVSRSTIYRWQKEGRVRGFKVGRQWRFRRSDLESFSQMTTPSAAAVKVGELDRVVAELAVAAKGAGDIVFDPALEGYPLQKRRGSSTASTARCWSPR